MAATVITAAVSVVCAVSERRRRRRRQHGDITIRRPTFVDTRPAGVRRSEPRRVARQSGMGGAADHVRLRSPRASSWPVLWPRGPLQQLRGSSSAAYRGRSTPGLLVSPRRVLRSRRPGTCVVWHFGAPRNYRDTTVVVQRRCWKDSWISRNYWLTVA